MHNFFRKEKLKAALLLAFTIFASMSFEIHLPLFEGPFDLLLFFIERDELDIYDIPIAKVTSDFQEYLRRLEEMNMDVASEFIVVAAQLIRIKARMLLPRAEINDKGEEIDPRNELVHHLLEYKKFKEASKQLAENEAIRLARYGRGNIETELKQFIKSREEEAELESLDLYKLLKVFQKVMERFDIQAQQPRHVVVQFPYTIESQTEFIRTKLEEKTRLSFSDLVELMPEKMAVVFNFLAILEMIQNQFIDLVIGEGFNNFWILPKGMLPEQPFEKENP
jgi:segregation and condensation protein A